MVHAAGSGRDSALLLLGSIEGLDTLAALNHLHEVDASVALDGAGGLTLLKRCSHADVLHVAGFAILAVVLLMLVIDLLQVGLGDRDGRVGDAGEGDDGILLLLSSIEGLCSLAALDNLHEVDAGSGGSLSFLPFAFFPFSLFFSSYFFSIIFGYLCSDFY